MSTKPNYFKIGMFVITAAVLVVIAVIIWGAGLFTTEKLYYETYFDADVTGLAIGSPVLVRGVKIGQVERIDFALAVYGSSVDRTRVSKYERYIRVLCSVPREESKERVGDITDERRALRIKGLIEQGLRVQLASNILTGQSYLEGTFLDPNRYPILDIAWEPEYMHVPSAPGEFSTMKDSVDKILARLEQIDVKAIASNANQLLVELRQLVTSPDPNDVKGIAANANQFLVELRQLVKSKDANAVSTNVPEVLARLESVLERIDRELAEKRPEIDKIVGNIRSISDDIKELTAMLKEHPSEIIFSQPPAKSEMVR